MSNIYGELIRRVREEKGMTASECAYACLLSPEKYQKAEEGELELTHEELVLLTNALGISPSALENGQLVYKTDLPQLEALVEKLEEKLRELEQGIAEIRAVITETFSKEAKEPELEKKTVEGITAPAAGVYEPEMERGEELCPVK